MKKVPVSRVAETSLFAMAALWGSTLVVSKGLLTSMPVPDLLGVRFALATLALVVVRPSLLRMSRRTLLSGLALGAVLTAGQVLQTVGLARTSAATSGFLTGLYLVATPLLGRVILKHRVSVAVWVAVAMGFLGLAAIGVQPGGSFAFGWGEALTLGGAVLFGAHIVLLGEVSTPENAMSLTTLQMGVLAVFCLVWAAPGGIVLPHSTGSWLVMGYLAIVCGALALSVQAWAQSHLEATRAAVIMCSEPVWSAIFAVTIGGEVLRPTMVVGGVAIVLSAALVVVPLAVWTHVATIGRRPFDLAHPAAVRLLARLGAPRRSVPEITDEVVTAA